MFKAEDAAGLDLVWLGVDAKGQLAAFVTAGEGPIPDSALEHALTEPGVESQLLDLPLSSADELLIDAPNPASFIALSQRGLFVFDWQDAHRTLRESTQRYELVCRPSQPLSASELPPPLQAAAHAAAFDGLFSLQDSIVVGRQG